MNFNNLDYKEKIAVANLYYKDKYNRENRNDFTPKNTWISWNNFVFNIKAFDEFQIKVRVIENFFDNNIDIIRKEKLSGIKKNF